ncbi:TerB family tellurite resistance protein [Niastella caeni]|uniref:TerB family tellurite resistance protein n=1 Tax=Niastella caeni TaxID=2569763 RepID=A0A4S8H8D4_9BACT|nr:TerB family tellurite resistance protein [Niastella caeni]THU31120.1 TerB family tellurite resistance protein [Niastella caeni]
METTTVLEGYSDQEKGAYLGAMASIATADRQASNEELEYITALCDAADISETQKEAVIKAANELSGEELKKCLDILKNSDLKYSLVTDLIAFAKADNNYGIEEQQRVKETSDYLGVDQNQFSLLNEFTEKAATNDVPVEEKAKPSFLSSLGLSEKMKSAGINANSLMKGLLGVAGPLILGGILSGALRRRGRRGSSMFGNLGGMFGNSGLLRGAGLGSLIGMLSGGRGFRNTGGLLGRILH